MNGTAISKYGNGISAEAHEKPSPGLFDGVAFGARLP